MTVLPPALASIQRNQYLPLEEWEGKGEAMQGVRPREAESMARGGTIGIDPGMSGGIALIDKNGIVEARKMPETERDVYDLLVDLADGQAKAWIEKVGPMPKQGVSSTWKFGQHYGSLRMALIAAGIPFETVAPGVWQRALGCLSHGDKNVTKRKAQEWFPLLKVTHATADALLIAEYGTRMRNGGIVPPVEVTQ